MTSDISSRILSVPDELGAPSAPHRAFDVKRMLLQRAPVMIAVFALLGAPSLLAAWFLTPLEYEATATLQFLASTPRVMSREGESRGQPSYEKYVSTQIALIKNETILQRVIDDPAMAKSPALAGVDDPLEFLKRKVDARVERNSELVRISFRSADKDAAKAVVAKIVSAYLDYSASMEATAGGERMLALMQARDRLQTERERQLEQKSEMVRRVELPAAELTQLGAATIDIHRDALVRAEEAQAAAEIRLRKTQESIAQIKEIEGHYQASPGSPIYELEIENAVQQDGRVTSLRQQQVLRETELQTLGAQLTEGSMRLRRAREEASILEQKVSSTENTVRGEVLRSMRARLEEQVAAYEKDVADSKERVEEVNKRIEDMAKEYEARAVKAASTAAEYDEMNMRVEETRRTLGGISDEITTLTLESNAPARVRLASESSVPNRPYQGTRFRFLGLAFAASLACGFGTGVLRELTDQHTRSAQDVAAITTLPVLAAIPHFKEDRLVKAVQAHMVTADSPHSPTADEYRRILARIVYPPDSTVELTSCLVASPSRGDGKTSVACNLAILLARANRRVLLVDTCGCSPSIEECFGLTPSRGLSEVLYQGIPPNAVLRPTEVPNVEIIGPGLRGKDLSSKLASREMTEFLESVEREFDHVIIDSVPSLLMSDAKLLAPIVDGVLVVIGVGVSTRGMVSRCLNEMGQVNAEVIGIVVNGIRPTRGGYLRRNLDMYYRYSDETENKVSYEDISDIPEIKIVDAAADEEPEPIILLTASSEESDREKTEQT